MALTTGFKRLVTIVAIVGAVSVGLWQGQKNNYWGLLEKTQVPQQAEAPAPAPVKEVPAATYMEAPTKAMAAPVQSAPEVEAPVPAQEYAPKNKSTINKLKSLDKL